jgi:hypothetical protein
LGVQPQRYFSQPSEAAEFAITARDYDGKAVSTDVHLELAQWNWRKRSASEVKASIDVHTDAQGSASAAVKTPAQGGSYQVRVTARGAAGREIE